MDKIRVLFFIYSLSGGGAERQLGYLIKASDKSLFSYAICCVDNRDPKHLYAQAEIITIPQQWHPFRSNSKNKINLDHWKPDIVHTWIPLVLPESLNSGKMAGRQRFLASYRNVYTLNHVRRLHQFICLFKVGGIVSNVEPKYLKRPFSDLYNLKSGVFIPNGFDIAAMQKAERMNIIEEDTDIPKVKILYVGRFAKHKNLKALLNALFLIKSMRDIRFHLVLCGNGKQEVELKKSVAELSLKDDVTFMGYRENVYQVMKSCDCLVLPSFHEGMPNVLFEAMLAKLPVVASDISVHRRWSQDGRNAILFDPQSPESLKDGLLKVFHESDHEREARIEAAYQYAAQFSIASMVNKYEDLYQSIMTLANRK